MKYYTVVLKTLHDPDVKADVAPEIATYNHDIEKITNWIKTYPQNYCHVLKQVLVEKDEILLETLSNALLEYNIFSVEKQIQKIITDNGHEVLVALAAHGYTKIIYRFLDILPYEQQFNKTLILNLITAAAINSHSDTVGSLIKNLFPE